MRSVLSLGVLGLVLLAVQAEIPEVQIIGPQYPIQEGQDVTLECLSDLDLDMENYTFQKYSKWMKSWFDLDKNRYFRCWYYNLNVSRVDGRLLLHLSEISEWQSGPYRCVSRGNESDDMVASDNFSVPVYYMRDIYLQRYNAWNPSVSDVLYVEEGSEVEIKCSASSSQQINYEWSQEYGDWILPSDTLVLKKVDEEVDSGTYTCKAFNPDMYGLTKKKSFELRVVPKQAEFKFAGLDRSEILLYFAAPALMLLLPLLTLLLLIIRYRRRQLRKPQISLVDTEKRSPIYKGSFESVYTSTTDTQPLVK
ncbi:cell surface glycoprotein MUC18-like [Discoglossus pictus]